LVGLIHRTVVFTTHRGALDALAEALLARETLDEQEILAVTGLPPAPALNAEPLSRGQSR